MRPAARYGRSVGRSHDRDSAWGPRLQPHTIGAACQSSCHLLGTRLMLVLPLEGIVIGLLSLAHSNARNSSEFAIYVLIIHLCTNTINWTVHPVKWLGTMPTCTLESYASDRTTLICVFSICQSPCPPHIGAIVSTPALSRLLAKTLLDLQVPHTGLVWT